MTDEGSNIGTHTEKLLARTEVHGSNNCFGVDIGEEEIYRAQDKTDCDCHYCEGVLEARLVGGRDRVVVETSKEMRLETVPTLAW